MRVVVKIGTSSLTDADGAIDVAAVAKLSRRGRRARAAGASRSSWCPRVRSPPGCRRWAGTPTQRPRDARTLQAVSAVGQARLVQTWTESLGAHGLVAGQVLLAPLDFMVRAQYLQARGTLDRLLELGVVPVVNENDAVADDELRFGDNDRIAALVAQLLGADLLVLLTDAPGLMDADPRFADRTPR